LFLVQFIELKMKEFLRKNWSLLSVGLITLVLAVVAIGTAWKLYQAGTEPVAPTTPSSIPKAQEEPTATPIPEEPCVLEFEVVTPTPTPTGTVTPTPSDTPTPTPTGTVTPVPTDTPTPTSTPGPTSTPTPTSTPKPGVTTTPTPTPVELPSAGISLPTIGTLLGGLLLITLSIILAL
jgi:hypothetical protein